MKSFVLALLLGTISCASLSWAQTPPRFEPRVTAAMRAPYYFAMLPAQYDYKEGDYEETTPARGIAYRLAEDGTNEELWAVEDWYATTVYLAADGHHLVRMGNWPEGNRPEQEDLAVAFYKDGELLKSYSTADLVGNPNNVRPESGHYFWLSRDERYPDLTYSNHFLLKTIENKIFEFDISTGDIIGTMAESVRTRATTASRIPSTAPEADPATATTPDATNIEATAAESSNATVATSERPARATQNTRRSGSWDIRQDGPASFSNIPQVEAPMRPREAEILEYRP